MGLLGLTTQYLHLSDIYNYMSVRCTIPLPPHGGKSFACLLLYSGLLQLDLHVDLAYDCTVPLSPSPPTTDAVPTVSGVERKALTLDTVLMAITFSDDGGQPVLEYTVCPAHVNGWVVYATGECHE